MLGATVKQEHWPVHPGSNERKTCAPYYQTRYIEQRICIWMNVIKVIEKWVLALKWKHPPNILHDGHRNPYQSEKAIKSGETVFLLISLPVQ